MAGPEPLVMHVPLLLVCVAHPTHCKQHNNLSPPPIMHTCRLPASEHAVEGKDEWGGFASTQQHTNDKAGHIACPATADADTTNH